MAAVYETGISSILQMHDFGYFGLAEHWYKPLCHKAACSQAYTVTIPAEHAYRGLPAKDVIRQHCRCVSDV